MYLHTATYLAIEAHFKWALYNCSMGNSFFLYKNLSSWFKRYKLGVQYTLTQDAPYPSPGQDPVVSYIVTDVCIHNSENINSENI